MPLHKEFLLARLLPSITSGRVQTRFQRGDVMPWTWWVSIIAALTLGMNLGVVLMGMLLADSRD